MSMFRRRLLMQQALRVPAFPEIPGLIARYSARGLTNEEMAKTNVWKDLTGNGHDITLHNFAWGGMSGIGGYPDNLRNYQINDYDGLVTEVVNDHKFTINGNIRSETYYQVLSNRNDYSAKRGSLYAKGIPDDFYFVYQINSSTSNPNGGIQIKNGLNEFDLKPNETSNFMKFQFLNQTGAIIENVNIEIEFLPLHKGALVSDGVDDYGICENFPILTKENGYTVVAVREHLSSKRNQITCSKSPTPGQGEFIFDQTNESDEIVGFNFGAGVTSDLAISDADGLFYQTSKLCNGRPINSGQADVFDNNLYLFNVRAGYRYYAYIALYDLLIYDRDLTEEEIGKIKTYFAKIHPDLSIN